MRITLLLLAAVACGKPSEPVKEAELPIACSLNALDDAQRHREGELLGLHLASFRERKELPDGYVYRYDDDPKVLFQIEELVTLERKCCPFLAFRMAAPWLYITGGARVKPFVDDTFGGAVK